ncbi:SH3 domain-containing kinase-binding protein 1 isoform X2 [Eucyclogobius newberryi]|uniref:SH3 domain-containing kinase-binding protein 1 isoform X2 n=1 Tax=Eucyclogobius newberryi TaxID=166745 RepID=UPI003B5C3A2C
MESERRNNQCVDEDSRKETSDAALPPGHNRNPPTSENTSPLNLEQLQNELTVLRGQFEQMKAQHNKEIKLLMNELDEEKKIRLTLQMELKRIKKHMSK